MNNIQIRHRVLDNGQRRKTLSTKNNYRKFLAKSGNMHYIRINMVTPVHRIHQGSMAKLKQ